MSRKSTLIQTAVWENIDFTSRTTQAQLVYLMLLTQPTVAATGMLAMTTRKWARYTTGHLETVEAALTELEEHTFVWLDQIAEELVIRSWVKHNVLGSPKMETAAINQFDAITSRKLRRLLAAEYPQLDFPLEPADTLSADPGYPIDPVSGDLAQPSRIDTVSQETAIPRGAWSMENGVMVHGVSVEVSRARARSDDDRSRPPADDVQQVWSIYREFHPRANLTADRRRLIERRLREWPVETLVDAIRGNHADPWCNERGHHDLQLIIRNADKIERYAGIARDGAPAAAATSGPRRALVLARQAAEMEARNAS